MSIVPSPEGFAPAGTHRDCVTCPGCATRYHIDGSTIPATGRTMRCTRCHRVWHEIPTRGLSEPAKARIRALLALAERLPANPPKPSTAEKPPSALPAMAFQPVRDSDIVSRAALPQLVERSRPNRFRWLALGVVILMVLLQSGSSRQVAYDQPLAGPVPSLALAAPGGKTEGRIELTNVSYEREAGSDAATNLVVKGTIENSAGRELPMPKNLRISLRDSSDTELYATYATPNVARLGAGQSVPFVTRIYNIPQKTTRLQVDLER